MPNWCNNKVIISNSEPEKIAELYHLINKNSKKALQCLRPIPKELLQSNLTSEEKSVLEEKFGTSDELDWCVENWGTNRDIYIEKIKLEDRILTLNFDSAWSPPLALYEFLSDEGWNIEAYYYEPGIAFCGAWDSVWGSMGATFDRNNIPPIIIHAFGLDAEEWRNMKMLTKSYHKLNNIKN